MARPLWSRPGDAAIEAYLAARRPRGKEGEFSYPEVGASSLLGEPLPERLAGRYDLDHLRVVLGHGREVFARARSALFAWRHFDVPWVELRGATEPAHEGQVVATLASIAGIWLLNPCRVVYTSQPPDAPNVAAFAYGTLPGHVEIGEERFVVSIDPTTEAVHYEIEAFSRPASLWVRLGRPFARRMQRRFALATGAALRRAVSGSLAG
jgi:uncharacterized protein (UPF0548 family)